MNKIIATICTLVLVVISGCASDPDKLGTTYISPLQYKDYDCEQIASEMGNVERRTAVLYNKLRKERTADNWQTGIGLVLFWPALLFLEGGDGPEAAEYSNLKGTYKALQEVAIKKKCGIESKSPEQIIKEANEKEK